MHQLTLPYFWHLRRLGLGCQRTHHTQPSWLFAVTPQRHYSANMGQSKRNKPFRNPPYDFFMPRKWIFIPRKSIFVPRKIYFYASNKNTMPW